MKLNLYKVKIIIGKLINTFKIVGCAGTSVTGLAACKRE